MFNNVDAAISIVTFASLITAVVLIAAAFVPEAAPVRAQPSIVPQTTTGSLAPRPHRTGERLLRRSSPHRGPWTL
jgi:hypothetical protein